MLRTLVTSSAAIALAVAAFGAAPASAQEERMCNPVVDAAGEPVVDASDLVVTHMNSYPCPPPPVAAVAEPAAPAPAAAPLPERGEVFFPFDVATLTPEATQTVDTIAQDIIGRDLGGIMVIGHTDTAGPPEYNLRLSERRAENVAAQLIREGIPATIITTEGVGENDLAVDTPDNTPMQANRRATIDFERAG
jgi:OmpA-OmpF porin, OOP family